MRRIVTGHDSNGISIIDKDDEIERLDVTPEHATFAVRLPFPHPPFLSPPLSPPY